MTIEECTNIEELRPLGEEWLEEIHAGDYGLDVDLNVIAEDLESWMKGEGVIFTAKEDGVIVGLIAVFATPSYLGGQKIALEKYWYCRRGSHVAGPRLYVEAVEWARKHGCSHMITSGSKMASGRHDAICHFLEKTGAKHFETSYIYRL